MTDRYRFFNVAGEVLAQENAKRAESLATNILDCAPQRPCVTEGESL